MSAHQPSFEELAARSARQNDSIGLGFWLFAIGTTLAIGLSITWLLTRPEANLGEQPEVAVVDPQNDEEAVRSRGTTKHPYALRPRRATSSSEDVPPAETPTAEVATVR